MCNDMCIRKFIFSNNFCPLLLQWMEVIDLVVKDTYDAFKITDHSSL